MKTSAKLPEYCPRCGFKSGSHAPWCPAGSSDQPAPAQTNRFEQELNEAKADNERLRQVKESYQQRAISFSDELAALRQWSEQAREALQFYAFDDNYRLNGYLDPNGPNFRGSITAQKVLASHPEKEQATGRAPNSGLDAPPTDSTRPKDVPQSQEKAP